jgi:quercetin dioxygenase-like cupin family protein
MTTDITSMSNITVKRNASIQETGPDGLLDRYVLESADSGGALAVVEHVLGPRMLAAPVHRHSREDEYSYVLAGRLAVWEEGQQIIAEAGDLVSKPRGRWHTFWNAGDTELRVLELITPGGLEELFRKLGEPGGEYDPETLPGVVEPYGCELDFEATMPLVERHALIF